MDRGANLLVIALVFVLGVVVGYGVGLGVWTATPNQVARLHARDLHPTKRASEVQAGRPASAGQDG